MCNFEEVYSDGSIQTGLFLLKNEDLRYQYDDPNLFTIFKNNNHFYYVENFNTDIFKKLTHQTNLIEELIYILNNYPNIKNTYENESLKIILERSKDNNFIKRVSVQTDEINLSIYLHSCENSKINGKYLQYFPFFKY